MKYHSQKTIIEIEVRTSLTGHRSVITNVNGRRIPQSRTSQPDPWWTEKVKNYLICPITGETQKEVTMREILEKCFQTKPSRDNLIMQRQVGAILRTLGWFKKSSFRNGRSIKLWIKEDPS